MSETRTPKLAVLIDADNVPHKYVEAIFSNIAVLGEASVRRVYGDAEKGFYGWNNRLVDFGLVAHHQPPNTTGKNASDIALVIDAMDLMHSGRFDGFVLVSSDSDFTRLAQRLREEGLDVYGMGERKTPAAFRAACKRFILVENLVHDAESAPTDSKKGETAAEADAPGDQDESVPIDVVVERLTRVVDDLADEDGWSGLGGVGSQMVKLYPDFDSRTYGHKRLSDLIKTIAGLEIRGSGKALKVRVKS